MQTVLHCFYILVILNASVSKIQKRTTTKLACEYNLKFNVQENILFSKKWQLVVGSCLAEYKV